MYHKDMVTDKYGQLIFSEDDLFDLVLSDPDRKLKNVQVYKPIINTLDSENFPKLELYNHIDNSIENFDIEHQTYWFMPDKYKNLDIVEYLLTLCSTDIELERIGVELVLYQERNLFDLLRYLKYLVDTMRENNIVWGVGRGSSVASYVLFLLGVHKIDSIKYELPISEFLK